MYFSRRVAASRHQESGATYVIIEFFSFISACPITFSLLFSLPVRFSLTAVTGNIYSGGPFIKGID